MYRIPLDEDLTRLHRLAVVHLQAGAVDDRIPLAVATLRVLNDQRPGAVHDNHFAGGLFGACPGLDHLQTLEAGRAGVFRVERGLLRDSRCRSTDVERPHRQLRARLADRLRGDDADRQTELDEASGREVAAVALGAAAAAAGAGEDRTDPDLLDAAFLDVFRLLLVDHLVHVDDQITRQRIEDPLERDAADDAVAKRLDDLTRFHDRACIDAVHGAAVVLVDDDVLRHVHQSTGQIARVGGLQRGVGKTLARAVGGDEVLHDGEPFAEVRRDRRLDDLAGRLGHQAAHARQLTDLLLRASGARVRHDVDGVEVAPRPVERLHFGEHLVSDLLGDIRPDRDDLVVSLTVGDRPFEILPFDLDHLFARFVHELHLLLGDDEVIDPDREARSRGVSEPEVLQAVEHLDGLLETKMQVAVPEPPAAGPSSSAARSRTA